MMLCFAGIISGIVDATHDRHILILGGRGNDDFFTVPRRCLAASFASVKRPVDSTTTCTPRRTPVQFGRIFHGKDFDIPGADDDARRPRS